MPKLNEVISAILSSLSNAQHQSNQVSSRFAESYKNDETMKYFALPNATVSDADITLRYAIKDMVTATMPHLARVMDVSSESRFAAHHRARKIIHLLMCDERFQALFKGTDIDAREIAKSHIDEISQVIYEGNKNGHDEKEIIREIIGILTKTFEKFPSVAKNFKDNFKSSDDMTEIALACIKRSDEEIANIAQKRMGQNGDKTDGPSNKPNGHHHFMFNPFKSFFKNKPDEPTKGPKDIEIIIDNDILQRLPESIIQTIQFKAHVKNYHWIVNDKSTSGEFILTD